MLRRLGYPGGQKPLISWASTSVLLCMVVSSTSRVTIEQFSRDDRRISHTCGCAVCAIGMGCDDDSDREGRVDDAGLGTDGTCK